MPDIQKILNPALWLITSGTLEIRAGLIATFVNPASIVPELPRMLVGIARQHHTWRVIESSRTFTLHLLDETQLDLVWRFGLQSGHRTDKFVGLSTTQSGNGCPRLADVVAWLDCRVEASMETGDRTVYLGEVLESAITKQTAPLTMQRLLQLAPPERLDQLRAGMQRDAVVDAAAIQAWRASSPPASSMRG